jgi:hypothetical protein
VFVGLKMLLDDVVHVPTWVALSVIGVTLAVSITLSVARPRAESIEADAESLEGKRGA